jgi:hypothetical protein
MITVNFPLTIITSAEILNTPGKPISTHNPERCGQIVLENARISNKISENSSNALFKMTLK